MLAVRAEICGVLLWHTTHLLNNLLRQTHRTNPPNCVTGTNAIWEVMGLGCRFTCEHFAYVVELVGDSLTEQRSREASFCQVETDKLGWVTTAVVFVLVVGAWMNGMSASCDAIIVWIIRRHIACRISDVWLCVGTNHAGVDDGVHLSTVLSWDSVKIQCVQYHSGFKKKLL